MLHRPKRVCIIYRIESTYLIQNLTVTFYFQNCCHSLLLTGNLSTGIYLFYVLKGSGSTEDIEAEIIDNVHDSSDCNQTKRENTIVRLTEVGHKLLWTKLIR